MIDCELRGDQNVLVEAGTTLAEKLERRIEYGRRLCGEWAVCGVVGVRWVR